MGKGAVLSGLLHLTVVLLAVFGLPWLYDTNEVLQLTPVSVISEAQFAELKNQKPPAQQKKPDQPKDKEIPPAPKAPDVAQPEPEPEPPPEPEPQQAAEPPPQPQPPREPPPQQAEPQQPAVQPEPPPEPPQQVVTPEPPPQPKPEPVQPPEPQVAEAQPKPVPPKKPTPPKKKEEPKKKDEPKERSLDDIIGGLVNKDKDKDRKKKPAQQQAEQQAALPQDSYDGPPVTEGEKDAIRQQIKGNWIIDIGMQGLEEMTVEVKVRMNPDGSVVSAKADPNSSNGHPNWPIYARSCENAVLKSSPLRMPPDKPYQAWATMTLVFNAREMLGY